MLGVNGRRSISEGEHPKPSIGARLRARWRRRPCAIGLHQMVLTTSGNDIYFLQCEHCGIREGKKGSSTKE